MTKYPGYEHIRQILREHYAGGRVLDIGAGPATYRELFDDYVGVDLPTTPYEGTLEAYCDAQSLPFRPGVFDLVFVQAALFLMPNPELVCQEVWIALKKNGLFHIVDYTESVQVGLMKKHLAQLQRKHLSMWNSQELARLLYHSGFRDIQQIYSCRLERILYRFAPRMADRKFNWLMYKATK